MASYTTNLNLKKPAGSENVAIGDINNNMDAIDQAYGSLSSQVNVKLNQSWKTYPSKACTLAYCYESSTAATDYDLPYNYCFVVVHWYTSVRAVAYAIQWNSSSKGAVWVNNLHDTWQGWKQISAPSSVTVSVESKDSRCGSVSTTCRRVGNVVELFISSTFDFSASHWTAGTNAEIKLAGLPLPAMISYSSSYLSGNIFGVTLQVDGTVRFRNTSSELSSNQASLVTSFTYITND